MKYFKNIEVSRPSLESCDANSPESVYVFLARENLECAVSCDPSTSLERAREICRIISGEFVTGEYLHLEIHPNYSKGLEKYKDSLPESRAHEMLAYFDVWLKESPQDTEEHEAILSLVQRYIQLAQRIL